ncbi:hypothetical protein B0H13DRAFT_2662696 [Mycena leptocephala]|nr:hypothetical protein B0H13DRAFT_2662696 [Mycena leptocephala]
MHFVPYRSSRMLVAYKYRGAIASLLHSTTALFNPIILAPLAAASRCWTPCHSPFDQTHPPPSPMSAPPHRPLFDSLHRLVEPCRPSSRLNVDAVIVTAVLRPPLASSPFAARTPFARTSNSAQHPRIRLTTSQLALRLLPFKPAVSVALFFRSMPCRLGNPPQ